MMGGKSLFRWRHSKLKLALLAIADVTVEHCGMQAAALWMTA